MASGNHKNYIQKKKEDFTGMKKITRPRVVILWPICWMSLLDKPQLCDKNCLQWHPVSSPRILGEGETATIVKFMQLEQLMTHINEGIKNVPFYFSLKNDPVKRNKFDI
ncbi:hypothetical protein Glove_230g203 [Diversispora epigaea]|uniref:Uncharacterized protein n=1 Tax=Diversispora epigaea TaxID=1348612 RepID=A0A397ILM4_9GLOM|nr:hypothetical protein Glove_230g203 [Diversispora epigaea]